MALYETEQIVKTGLEPTSNAVSASDTFANGTHTFLRVVNGSGDALTVTIVTSALSDGDLAIADRTISIPDGEVRYLGNYNSQIYGSTVTVTFSATTDVFVECVRF